MDDSIRKNMPTPDPMDLEFNEDREKVSERLQHIWNRSLNYNYFSGKAKMHYEGNGMKQDFTANFRIKKDEVVWVSIVALGMVNVARAYITPDSIKAVYYLNKEVYQMRTEDAKKLLSVDLDFNTLQNLIIGNALDNSGKPINMADFGGALNLMVVGDQVSQQVTYNKTDTTLRTVQMVSNRGTVPFTGMIQYGSYELVDNKKFATKREININSDNKLHYLNMSFNNAEFGEEVSFPFSIPSNYKQK